jgi:hypothetical protein
MITHESAEMLLGITKQVHTHSRSIREDEMDQVPAGETSSDTTRARRGRMRARARGLRPVPPPEQDVFQTPQWLERSFVLPLTEPQATDVPSQPVPHHDDYGSDLVERPTAEPEAEPASTFVRPPTPEIDFARVIRRSDLSRTASRTALSATGIAGLLVVLYLLLRSPVVLGMALAFGLIALVSVGVRVRLATAAVPHLER